MGRWQPIGQRNRLLIEGLLVQVPRLMSQKVAKVGLCVYSLKWDAELWAEMIQYKITTCPCVHEWGTWFYWGLGWRFYVIKYVDCVNMSICIWRFASQHLHSSKPMAAPTARQGDIASLTQKVQTVLSKGWDSLHRDLIKRCSMLCKTKMAKCYHSSTPAMHEHLTTNHPGALWT